MNLKEEIERQIRNLALVERIAQINPHLDPYYVSATGPIVHFLASRKVDVLLTFGRDGWKRKNPTFSSHLDWHKRVDGVEIVIERVEAIEPPKFEEEVQPEAQAVS